MLGVSTISPMDQIYPHRVVDVDPEVVYAADAREPRDARPWVLSNMIASVDGATTVAGRSTGLGGPGDLRVFRALRGVADVVLVGAGTVRAEDYGPVRLPESIQTRRRAEGRAPRPRLAVVSGRLDLDPAARLFSEPGVIVITSAGSDEARRHRLAEVAQVFVTPGDRVDLGYALARLREEGHRVVLTEGGPTINGQLAAAGLLDELCLTVAGLLAGGDSRRILSGTADLVPPIPMRLGRVLVEGDELYLRYLTGAAPGA